MILKIKDGNNTWWMYDNLKRIHHGNHKEKEVFFYKEDNQCYKCDMDNNSFKLYPDIMFYGEKMDESDDKRYMSWACVMDTRDNEKFIVFDTSTIVYILNDEGKTIDKI